MRLMIWILSILSAIFLIVHFVIPKFISKKEAAITIQKQPDLPQEEILAAQITQKTDFTTFSLAVNNLSKNLKSDTIKTLQPEIDPKSVEARLQSPGLSDEENIAAATKRVEAAEFYEKVKQSRDKIGDFIYINSAALPSKNELPDNKVRK